ncbi:MAG: tetratricopeptide repeat protein [Magnetococcales bacterium]|nr:tetratricopeptide repeat protein [Magnetococcales bacterium]
MSDILDANDPVYSSEAEETLWAARMSRMDSMIRGAMMKREALMAMETTLTPSGADADKEDAKGENWTYKAFLQDDGPSADPEPDPEPLETAAEDGPVRLEEKEHDAPWEPNRVTDVGSEEPTEALPAATLFIPPRESRFPTLIGVDEATEPLVVESEPRSLPVSELPMEDLEAGPLWVRKRRYVDPAEGADDSGVGSQEHVSDDDTLKPGLPPRQRDILSAPTPMELFQVMAQKRARGMGDSPTREPRDRAATLPLVKTITTEPDGDPGGRNTQVTINQRTDIVELFVGSPEREGRLQRDHPLLQERSVKETISAPARRGVATERMEGLETSRNFASANLGLAARATPLNSMTINRLLANFEKSRRDGWQPVTTAEPSISERGKAEGPPRAGTGMPLAADQGDWLPRTENSGHAVRVGKGKGNTPWEEWGISPVAEQVQKTASPPLPGKQMAAEAWERDHAREMQELPGEPLLMHWDTALPDRVQKIRMGQLLHDFRQRRRTVEEGREGTVQGPRLLPDAVGPGGMGLELSTKSRETAPEATMTVQVTEDSINKTEIEELLPERGEAGGESVELNLGEEAVSLPNGTTGGGTETERMGHEGRARFTVPLQELRASDWDNGPLVDEAEEGLDCATVNEAGEEASASESGEESQRMAEVDRPPENVKACPEWEDSSEPMQNGAAAVTSEALSNEKSSAAALPRRRQKELELAELMADLTLSEDPVVAFGESPYGKKRLLPRETWRFRERLAFKDSPKALPKKEEILKTTPLPERFHIEESSTRGDHRAPAVMPRGWRASSPMVRSRTSDEWHFAMHTAVRWLSHLSEAVIHRYLQWTSPGTKTWVQYYNKRGQHYFRRGMMREAMNCYGKSLEKEANNVAALAGLGRCHLKLEDLEQALEYLQRAREQDDQGGAWLDGDVIVAYIGLKRHDQAEEWIRRRLQQQTEVTSACGTMDASGLQFQLGEILNLQGRHEEAVLAYEEAVALKPERLEYRRALGWALQAAGRNQEAIQLLKTIATDNSDTVCRDELVEA